VTVQPKNYIIMFIILQIIFHSAHRLFWKLGYITQIFQVVRMLRTWNKTVIMLMLLILSGVVQKPVNVNPGLNVNCSIFSCLEIFFASNIWCNFRLLQLKTEGANKVKRTLHQKVMKLKWKFSLTLGWLNHALNNLALKNMEFCKKWAVWLSATKQLYPTKIVN